MKTPYTYAVRHKPSGKWYYGVRFARGCHPSDLWVKYFTSSKVVHALIKTDGAEAFEYEVRRVFRTEPEARDWEFRVLKRMRNHPLIINRGFLKGVTPEMARKTRDTKMEVGEDGLNGFQTARAKTEEKIRNQVCPETGVPLYRVIGAKIMQHPNTKIRIEATRQKLLGPENPVNTPGIKEKISASVKRAVQEGRLACNKGKKIPKISEALKGNQYATNKIWFTNGTENLRLPEGANPPDGYSPGRAKMPRKKVFESLTCPHCGFEGGGGNMQRYHFDNCKSKATYSISKFFKE